MTNGRTTAQRQILLQSKGKQTSYIDSIYFGLL